MTQVLIVGAGPVGLSMAAFLNRYQIKCRIIDQKSGLTQTSNAIMVNSRSLEIFESLALTNTMIQAGLKIEGANYFFSACSTMQQLSFKNLKSRYHFGLALPQAQTEKILTDYLATHNINVEYGYKITQLSQDMNGVSAICETKNGQEMICAAWCVGCDGYHSLVRQQANIDRHCHDLKQHFFMADVQLTSPLPPDYISAQLFNPKGALLLIPMKHATRIVAEISHDPQFKDIPQNSAEVFSAILQQRYPQGTIQEIDWLSSFWVHECLAKCYRNKRIFLTGDAAHTHSPAGGQGMNTGIQDAWNLAWKLAFSIRKQVSEKILDSYSLERRYVAQQVLQDSGRLTEFATTINPLVIWIGEKILPLILKYFPFLSIKMVNHLMQNDIRYQPSFITQKSAYKNVGMKSNYLDPNGQYMLLLPKKQLDLVQHKLSKYGYLLSLKVSDMEPCISDKTVYHLIRPDGHLAGIYQQLDDVIAYFKSLD